MDESQHAELAIAGHPAETGLGIGLRPVFASHPAVIAKCVNVPEYPVIVDFTGAGLVTAGVVGDLDMADASDLRAQCGAQFALHALGVIDVVLQNRLSEPTSSMIDNASAVRLTK